MNKLVVLTSRFPLPLDKGDKLRAYHQIKHLANYYEIYLISFSTTKITPQHQEELRKYCKELYLFELKKTTIIRSLVQAVFTGKPFQVAYFNSKKHHKQVTTLIRKINPHHIYCQLIRTVEYIKPHVDIPKTLDYMDALSKGMERRIPTAKFYLKPLIKIEAARLKKYENSAFHYFNHHVIISRQDRELIFIPQRDNIKTIPNGIDTDYFTPDFKTPKKPKYHLLFNGNMQYQPNVKAAVYIVKNIMPLVWKQTPNITLLISGTNPTKEVLHLGQHPNITVSGWMNDIRNAYANCQVFIAPMQIGTGLQNKLLEAMAMKIPCVTSSLANNALQATHHQQILIGNTPQEYADLILTLLDNSALRSAIAQAGYEYVKTRFSWQETANMLHQIMG